jgi:hypothetical protein
MKSKTVITPPEKAITFEPEEFAIVYNLVARASLALAARRGAGLGVKGGDDAGVSSSARGAVLGAAFGPVRERYKGDPVRYDSAVHRMTALAKLLKGPHLRQWTRVTKEGVAVDKAVLAAAAVMPLSERCEFQVGDFVEEVKRLSRRGEA